MLARSAGDVRRSRELALRVASAAVLIPFGITVVALGGWALCLACAAFAAIMGWEWAKMARLNTPMVHGALAMAASIAAGFGGAGTGLIASGAAALAAALYQFGPLRRSAYAAFGSLYAALPPLAMFLVREGPNGLVLTMVIMVFVWVTDIAAFFGGRAMAGPLLSPKESPNKRWSGALAAFSATVLAGLAFALGMNLPLVAWLVGALSISVAAQFGDLLESSFKRSFGVKDSGSIVPGHGGLLDRVDGLGAAFCYAQLVFFLAPNARLVLGLAP